MPQPIDGLTSWSFGPKLLVQQEPDCIALIGLIAVTWARAEDDLDHLIGVVIGSIRTKMFGNTDLIISRMMSEAPNNRARIEMAKKALDPVFRNSALEKDWKDISDIWLARARERNKVVHAHWAVSEEVPGHLIRVFGDQRTEKWKKCDFEAVWQRIDALRRLMGNFHKSVSDAVAAELLQLR